MSRRKFAAGAGLIAALLVVLSGVAFRDLLQVKYHLWRMSLDSEGRRTAPHHHFTKLLRLGHPCAFPEVEGEIAERWQDYRVVSSRQLCDGRIVAELETHTAQWSVVLEKPLPQSRTYVVQYYCCKEG